jgi:hypothetical protein
VLKFREHPFAPQRRQKDVYAWNTGGRIYCAMPEHMAHVAMRVGPWQYMCEDSVLAGSLS